MAARMKEDVLVEVEGPISGPLLASSSPGGASEAMIPTPPPDEEGSGVVMIDMSPEGAPAPQARRMRKRSAQSTEANTTEDAPAVAIPLEARSSKRRATTAASAGTPPDDSMSSGCGLLEAASAPCEAEPAKAAPVVNLSTEWQLARVGSLVWALQKGFPWWPSMLTYDPASGLFRRVRARSSPVAYDYHVQFFGKAVTRAWVPQSRLSFWHGPSSEPEEVLLGKKKGKLNPSARLKADKVIAMKQCEEASAIRTSERLFEFIGNFEVKSSKLGHQFAEDDDPDSGTVLLCKDPNAPKKPLSAFQFFRRELLKNNAEFKGMKFGEQSKEVARRWSELSDKEKDVFNAMNHADKERYHVEMAAYKPASASITQGKSSKSKDPNAPKKPIQAFQFYRRHLVETDADFKALSFGEQSQELSTRWSALSKTDKEEYNAAYQADKKRYQKEMAAYVPSMNTSLTPAQRKASRDPNKPKKWMTPYFVFLQEKRSEFPQLSMTEATREVSKLWQDLSADEKVPYQAKSTLDKARYDAEMLKYTPPAALVSAADASADEDGGAVDALAPPPPKITKPKKPKSAEQLFALEAAEKLREEPEFAGNFEGIAKALSSKIATLWSNLPDSEREDYSQRAIAAKSEYDAAMEEYTSVRAARAEGKRQNEDGEGAPSAAEKRLRTQYSDVCSLCEEPGLLLECSGTCYCSYHPFCIGISVIPAGDFLCDACTTGNHRCFFCDETGDELRMCDHPGCNRSYHEDCAQKLPRSQFNTTEVLDEKFICPLHTCANCELPAVKGLARCIRCPVVYHSACVPAGVVAKDQSRIVCPRHFDPKRDKVDKKKANSKPVRPSASFCLICGGGGELICCDGCPGAYHAKCVTDKQFRAEDTEKWYCHDCLGGTKPMVDDIVWAKVGAYRFWPAQVKTFEECPEILQRKGHDDGEFPVRFFGTNEFAWVSNSYVVKWEANDERARFAQGTKKPAFVRALNEAVIAFDVRQAERKIALDRIRSGVKEVPVKFDRIRSNLWLCPKPPRLEVQECACDPQTGCGEDCMNKLLMIECDPKRCPAGKACMNDRIYKRRYPKLEQFKTSDGRGWGLRCGVDLSPGDFVVEYVGEIITNEECRTRLQEQEKAGTESFYMLQLDSDYVIDARRKANQARFANHSCDPNCVTQKWNVNGELRVGIFAKEHIPMGEEITFDYQLDCLGKAEKKRCYCGAKNCSGFIGGKATKKEDIDKEKRKKAKKKKAKPSAKIQEIIDFHESVCFRCKQDTGELLMCDTNHCPKVFCLSCIGEDKVPRGLWHCPVHYCDDPICGKKSKIFCKTCPNSFCSKKHIINGPNNERVDPDVDVPAEYTCWECSANDA